MTAAQAARAIHGPMNVGYRICLHLSKSGLFNRNPADAGK